MAHKPPYLETLFEKGMLLESEADAGKGAWSAALAHWEDLTKRMERMRPRPASYFDAWYHVAWVLAQEKETAKAKQALLGVMRLSPSVGGPEMKAKYQALRRQASMRNGETKMTRRSAAQSRSKSAFSLVVAAWAIGSWVGARGDDVYLVSGTTFKQAIGGRVRGQVQSESPSEVVVLLGANATSVPTDQIQSIRYDGQSASFALAEAREASGQLSDAAELFKKAATDSAGKPFPLQVARFREAAALTELAMVEPDRVKEAKDKLTAFLRAYPTSRHLAGVRDCQARLQLHSGDTAGAEEAIAALAKLPRGTDRAAVLRTRILAKQGKHAEAITQLDKLIASCSQGFRATTCRPARQG